MARAQREFAPGGIYHLFSRGSNRQAIFIYDSDRVDFLACLARVVERYELRCLGYCLMPNHYHLVVQTPDACLSHALKALNGRYSLRFNRRYQRDAHLFKNRFGAVLQERDEQFRWTLRYVARNPVDSGLCGTPEEWPWSSFRATAGMDAVPRFLDVGGVLAFFGDEPQTAMLRYRDLVTRVAAPAVSDTGV